MIKNSILSLATFVLVLGTSSVAQISSGKVEEKPRIEKTEKKKKAPFSEAEAIKATHIYVGFAPGSNFRTLSENSFPFGQPLGLRVDEESLNTWSFSAGLRNYFHKFFQYDVSVANFKFGEQYQYDAPDSDSAFNYKRTYNYISIPIMIYGTYGKRIQVKAGAGLVPQFFTNSKYLVDAKSKNGNAISSEVNQKNGFQSLNIGAQFSIGFQAQLNQNIGLYFLPAYLINFVSTLDKQGDYIHKINRINYHFGLVYSIPTTGDNKE